MHILRFYFVGQQTLQQFGPFAFQKTIQVTVKFNAPTKAKAREKMPAYEGATGI